MNDAKTGGRRLKWVVLFVVLDLALTAAIIAVYALRAHTKMATKPLDLKTEIMKAEEEATKHTGR